MFLFFVNSQNKRKYLKEVHTKQEINITIKNFLDEHNFKSYYTRIWQENNEWWFDVGSHTEFFILTGAPNDYYIIEGDDLLT